MGLLDGMLGNILGGMMGGGQQGAQGQNPLLAIVLQLLQQSGGLQGMLGKMQQAGFGEQAQSWVGTGQNMPISPDALAQIFGQGQLGRFAEQLGMPQQDVNSGLAQMLPDVVDQMTPQGQIPDNDNDLVAQALALLQKGR
ncbi:MAG: YidB family protein [Casimicrobiaceae bacterium]